MWKHRVGAAVVFSIWGLATTTASAEVPEIVVPNKGHKYVIWLNPLRPDGTKPPLTQSDITRYCSAAEDMARRIWRVTNGRHKIFQVEFVYGDSPMRADGVWVRADDVATGPDRQFQMYDGELSAGHSWTEGTGDPDGVTISGNVRKQCLSGVCVTATCPPNHTIMPSAFSPNRERCIPAGGGPAAIESATEAGWVLAHEAGHSHYDLPDEYFTLSGNDIQKIVYGFRICENPEWHTSLMGSRVADYWCDQHTHLGSRGVASPFSGTMVSQNSVVTNGDIWKHAKVSWTDLMSYDPGPAFTQGPGVVPQNEYFTRPAAAWAPLPSDQFCVFTGSEVANQVVNDVVVVVDKSGSMNYRMTPQDLTAFEHAFGAGLSHFNRTQPGRKSGLTVFDTTVTRTIPYAANNGVRSLSEFPLTASGLTNLCGAIADTAAQIRTSGTNDSTGHMVLLTDGLPTVPGCNTAEAVRTAAMEACMPTSGGKSVTISALGFGDADFPLIQQISDICGGSARMIDGSGPSGGNPVPPSANALPPGAPMPVSINVAASRLAYRVRNYKEAMFAQEQLPAVYERSFALPPGTTDAEFVWKGERTIRYSDPDSTLPNRCEFDNDYNFEVIDPNGSSTGFDAVSPSVEMGYMTRTRRISNPIPGTWTMRTTGGSPCVAGVDPAAPQVAMFAVYRNHRVHARLDVDKPVASANDAIRATASLHIGRSTLANNITVSGKLVNGTSQLSVQLFDDGVNGGDEQANDGVYTTLINPTCSASNLAPGGYRFVVELTSDPATAVSVVDPDADVRAALGFNALPQATPIPVSLVEEKLLTIKSCNAAATACGGTASTGLCPSSSSTIVGNPQVAPGSTVKDVTVTVRNCPFGKSGVTVGVGPGVTTQNVRSSYDDAAQTGTVTFDMTAAPTASPGSNPISIMWGRQRCDTTGAIIPVCREIPLEIPAATIAVCGQGGANNVTIAKPDVTGSCIPSPTITGRVITSNGTTLNPPRNIPSSGTISLVPGTHVVQWTLAGAGGATQTSVQTVFVTPGFAASGSFIVGDRARVMTSSTAYSAVLNGGPGLTEVGVQAYTGDILSRANVVVRDRGNVQGFIRTAGTVTRQNLTVVTGPIQQNQTLALGGVANPPVAFPPMLPGSDIIVPTDGVASAAPGAHRQLVVNTGGRLTLSAGDYVVEHLDIEPQARIVVTPQTRLFVKTSGIYRGLFTNAANQLAETFLAYYGTAPLALESNFTGLLFAANARVTLGDADSLTYRGRVLAKEVELRPDVTLTCSGAPTQVFKPLRLEAPAPLTLGDGDPAPSSAADLPLGAAALRSTEGSGEGSGCSLAQPGRGALGAAWALALVALLRPARRRRSMS